ncbi:MAG: S1 RNA-binding domain-containing protein [Phycisphaeraceae bacterium]|nr:S1 RNA-binding domain-containing protein [Phycisphaeraceae bacterium]
MSDMHTQMSGSNGTDPIDAEVESELAAAFGDKSVDQVMAEAAAKGPATTDMLDDAEADTAMTGDADDSPAPAASGESSPQVSAELKRGRIGSIRGDDVFIDLPGMDGKLQAVVPLRQFDRPPRVGSIMDFVVERVDEAEGLMHLSREGAASLAAWSQLQKGAVVEARVVGTNKGGLELEMIGGIRAFMPASQVDMHHVDNLDAMVGEKLMGIVHDIDRKGKKVVMSRRRYLEQQRERAKRKTWSTLEVGSTIEGKVTSIVPYGAFVDLGGVDGLVHISDLSHIRISKPDDIVQVGQVVQVQVLAIDTEKQRVRLGMKQAQPDPWTAVAGTIHAGDQVTGKVVRLADFGAFIELQPGVEGLLPVSEMSWRRNSRPADIVSEGQVLRLGVLNVDLEKRRLTLSLKASQGDPWVGAEHKYARNSIVEGTIKSVAEFGAFVEIEPGVEGLVHISELSPKRINRVEDVVAVGQKHQFRVLEISEDERKVKLSIKAVQVMPEPPAEVMRDRDRGGSGRGGRDDRPAPSGKKPWKPSRPLKGGIE